MSRPASLPSWRFDPAGPIVVTAADLDDVRALAEGCPVVTREGAARLLVTRDAVQAKAAAGAGVPTLLHRATAGEVDPPMLGFIDRRDLQALVPWALDRGAAVRRTRPRHGSGDLAWLAAIREVARGDEQRRRVQSEALSEHTRLLQDRIDHLEAHIAGVEASRAYRLSLQMREISRGRMPSLGPSERPLPVAPHDAELNGECAVESAESLPRGVAGDVVVRQPMCSSRLTVSVIVPTRDRADLVSRICRGLASTTTPHELIFVDNGSVDTDARMLLRRGPHRVVDASFDFNFSRLVNRGASVARGDVLVLLNNDIEVIDPNWMQPLLDHLVESGVGAVGGLLAYPAGTMQHCGIAVGPDGPVHPLRGCSPSELPGWATSDARRVTAVTAACMAVRADDFWAVDGFESLLATNYNDVDFCLRLAALGRSTVIEPRARLVHHEGATRSRESTLDVVADWHMFRSRWDAVLVAPDRWWPDPIQSVASGD